LGNGRIRTNKNHTTFNPIVSRLEIYRLAIANCFLQNKFENSSKPEDARTHAMQCFAIELQSLLLQNFSEPPMKN
jgi:hypothetical protein